MIQGVLLDLSGVLYTGPKAITGARDAVERLRAAGLPIRFLTNSTKSPRRRILAKLDKMGFAVDDGELFTPARMARQVLHKLHAKPHLLIHPDLAEDFEDLPEDAPKKAVVVGDAAEHFTYQAMNAAFRTLDNGATLLALAANRSFMDEDGQRSIDVGAFVRALEYASGCDAQVLGKPAPDYFAAALESMDCPAGCAVMVGDDAESDVAGALTAGLQAAVLVRTGKYRKGDETAHDPCPSHVADDLAAAVEWILER